MKRAEVLVGEAYDTGYRGVAVVVSHGWTEGRSLGSPTGNVRRKGNGVLVLRHDASRQRATISEAKAWIEGNAKLIEDRVGEHNALRLHSASGGVPRGWWLDIVGLAAIKQPWAAKLAFDADQKRRVEAHERATQEARQGRESDRETFVDGLTALGFEDTHLDVEFRRSYPGEKAVVIDVATFAGLMNKLMGEGS